MEITFCPTTDPSKIYHRAGWSFVISELQKMFPTSNTKSIRLIDLVEDYYLNPKNPSINKPWIGIIHHTKRMDHKKVHNNLDLEQLFNDKRFKRDLFYCKGLITLSQHLALDILTLRSRTLYFPKIHHLKHPTPLDVPTFNIDKFKLNQNKQLIFIGNQDRRLDRFAALNTSYRKLWLTGHKPSVMGVKINTVRVDNDEFDQLLTENIVLIDLYSSSANNTILECIARNTPIFVNNVGAVEEYLGKDYPLYFKDVEEIELKLNNTNMIMEAHEYLKASDHLKQAICINTFRNKLKHIIKEMS